MTAQPPSRPPRDLRQQRNQFVGFAFAAADVLIELDLDLKIAFASGAAASLVGRAPQDLLDQAFLELFAPTERGLVKMQLEALSLGDRLAPLPVRLSQAEPRTAIFGACRLPSDAQTYFVTLSKPVHSAPLLGQKIGRDSETGLIDKDEFVRLVTDLTPIGPSSQVTLLSIEGLNALRTRADDALASSFVASLGRQLQARSVHGDSAARLAPDRFGVIHDADLNIGELNQQVARLARSIDPAGPGIAVSGVTLTPQQLGDEADAARVLVYAINRFALSGDDLTMSALAAGVPSFIKGAVAQMRGLRDDLANQKFQLVYQPIVTLAGRQTHHYEALLRFAGGDSPVERISFAEQAGLIEELDLAVLCCVAQLVRERAPHHRDLQIAVNLSGRSLQSARFQGELKRRLDPKLAPHLLLEVTESAVIERKTDVAGLLSGLRAVGFRVCLDDFGAGAASFDYLNAFAADFIKIDGKYVRGMLDGARDREIVIAMTEMAKRLNIAVIAEQIETETQSKLLQSLGIKYGQGFLYGRPAALPPIAVPAPAVSPPKLNLRRRGGYQSWG